MRILGKAILLKDIVSWIDLEKTISELPSENLRGEAFEEFCKAFFRLEPIYQAKSVYRQKEIPIRINEKLGNPNFKDVGIDGIIETYENKIFAYQAKFRSSNDAGAGFKELSTFLAIAERADKRIVISNSYKVSNLVSSRGNYFAILLDTLLELDKSFFDRLKKYVLENQISQIEKKIPREDQRLTINKAATHYKENSRGKIIYPCGTGKTLMSLWIAEQINAKSVIYFMPSLSLMRQTLKEWSYYRKSDSFNYVCICSDKTVDIKRDEFYHDPKELGFSVSTDEESIICFLNNYREQSIFVFSTYQSADVIKEAVNRCSFVFDFGIFDEAHRTAGLKQRYWGLTLSDENIPIKKRLFMTATPRIYKPQYKSKSNREDIPIYSMDNEEAYGKTISEMKICEAIEKNIICDYEILISNTMSNEIADILNQSVAIIRPDEVITNPKKFASSISIIKAIKLFGINKIFTYHNRIKNAEEFISANISESIRNIIENSNDHFGIEDNMEFFHITGQTPAGEREKVFDEFKRAKKSLISNSRCLVEGVNIPVVDAVAFIDPKKSIIDIIQAAGRAMRISSGKKRGYIFVPVFIDEFGDIDALIDSSEFIVIWDVIQALKDQDSRINEIFTELRELQGKGEKDSNKWRDKIEMIKERIKFVGIPETILKNDFIDNVLVKVVERTTKKWDFMYGLTLKYMEKEGHGNPNVGRDYETDEKINLGNWQGDQRRFYKNKYMRHMITAERKKKLDDIGFKWELKEWGFDDWIELCIEYKKSNDGDPNAPAKYITPDHKKLGAWQDSMRARRKNGLLDKNEIDRIEAVGGFAWKSRSFKRKSPYEDSDEANRNGFEKTLSYKNATGRANAPLKYIDNEDFPLGRWQDKLKIRKNKGNLSQEQIELFNTIGFKWSEKKRKL